MSGFPSIKIAAGYGKKVLMLNDGALGGKCIENSCSYYFFRECFLEKI
jgi:pyruvate/2-oxoglutarate dehydrogenase complex dihydrolipoamide dehydrogenase (E3) component